MARYKLVRNVATVATALFLLSGCSPRSDCEIPSKHAHKYVEMTNLGKVERWEFSESMKYGGSDWTPDTIDLTDDDKKVVKTVNNHFRGDLYWDYLYNYMRVNKDYLQFYYEYYTYETRTTTDSSGKEKTKTVRVTHNGWHNNAYDSDNTGKVRVVHTRYCGSKIALRRNKDGSKEIWLEQSPYVDDIRDIVRKYPYYTFSPGETVCSAPFYCNKWSLSSLNAEDYSYLFNQPDLSKRELEPEEEKGPQLVLRNN